jgi:hypothetical protein
MGTLYELCESRFYKRIGEEILGERRDEERKRNMMSVDEKRVRQIFLVKKGNKIY